MKYTVRSVVWLGVYLLMVLLPLLALLTGSLPPARDFLSEFSAALGYSGLAIMGLQFGITARFRYVTEPWGEDVIYHFHRNISQFAVALVLIHPALMLIAQPALRVIPDLGDIPLGAATAFISVGALVVMVVTALWRTELKISYEWWHLSHIVLALTAIIGGIIHMVGWSFYLVDPFKRGLWIGLVTFWIGLLFYIRIIKPIFMLRRPYRVTEVRHERGDTTTLLMQPDGHDGCAFTPGQFGWLTTWGSPFKITAHPFSFSSSAAAKGGQVEMSIRKLGDFTAGIADIPVGRRVYLDGPYGAFTLGDPADMHVLIAGGVGVTPMMSMIRTLADTGDTRPVILIYGSKDWESITFREALDALKVRLDLTVVHVLANPPADWDGEQGYITGDLLKRHLPAPYAAHEYFICGPGVMMDAIETTLKGLGVPMSNYHSERYSFV